jgi:hypothetical protein
MPETMTTISFQAMSGTNIVPDKDSIGKSSVDNVLDFSILYFKAFNLVKVKFLIKLKISIKVKRHLNELFL